jgi:hypothetical protein
VEQPFPKFPQRIAKKTNFDMVLPNILLIGCQKAGTSAVRGFAHSFKPSLNIDYHVR